MVALDHRCLKSIFLTHSTHLLMIKFASCVKVVRFLLQQLAGNRTFEPWTVTIINDEDFAVRSTLEEWHQNINTVQGNVRQAGAGPEAYKSQGSVIHYGKQGNILREYKFIGIFPSLIAAIDLNWETEAIEEFQVTFEYDYFTVDNASEFGIAITA